MRPPLITNLTRAIPSRLPLRAAIGSCRTRAICRLPQPRAVNNSRRGGFLDQEPVEFNPGLGNAGGIKGEQAGDEEQRGADLARKECPPPRAGAIPPKTGSGSETCRQK